MSVSKDTVAQVKALESDKYKFGFETEIEQELAPKGLNEDIVRLFPARRANRNGCCNGGWTPIAVG